MQGLFLIGMGIVAAVLLSSCASSTPPPEAEWNRLGLWRKVSSDPATYIPTGYGSDRARGERNGTWFTDHRDGKRLFVPDEPVNGFPVGVLDTEAHKHTDSEKAR